MDVAAGVAGFVAAITYWVIALAVADSNRADMVAPERVTGFIQAVIDANRANYTRTSWTNCTIRAWSRRWNIGKRRRAFRYQPNSCLSPDAWWRRRISNLVPACQPDADLRVERAKQ